MTHDDLINIGFILSGEPEDSFYQIFFTGTNIGISRLTGDLINDEFSINGLKRKFRKPEEISEIIDILELKVRIPKST